MLHSPQFSRHLIANYAITDALQRRHDGLVRNASIDQSRRVFSNVNEKEEWKEEEAKERRMCKKHHRDFYPPPCVATQTVVIHPETEYPECLVCSFGNPK
jgi:hypothetical protein